MMFGYQKCTAFIAYIVWVFYQITMIQLFVSFFRTIHYSKIEQRRSLLCCFFIFIIVFQLNEKLNWRHGYDVCITRNALLVFCVNMNTIFHAIFPFLLSSSVYSYLTKNIFLLLIFRLNRFKRETFIIVYNTINQSIRYFILEQWLSFHVEEKKKLQSTGMIILSFSFNFSLENVIK